MNEELRSIKKLYGEKMMHLCRELFPSVLEQRGVLLQILKDHIAPTHSFAEDIVNGHWEEEFKDWIYSFLDREVKREKSSKTPFELMDEAGYILYECKTEEDIQRFRKYYAQGEELCTFRGGRLNRCYVFFAVKKNVDEIKREDFKDPRREDPYGTSVISIQFSRGETNTISIKNRYNHTVDNPDFTFSNDLEQIIPGLTDSFERYYGLHVSYDRNPGMCFLLSVGLNYVRANDGKYYRYNIEDNGVYYCENNIIIYDGVVHDKYAKNKERYLVIEQFIIDLKEKRITRPYGSNDTFTESIIGVGTIKNIHVLKENENRIINIEYDNGRVVKITINKNNSIIGYENNYVKTIGDNFLLLSKNIKSISLHMAERIGSSFLRNNEELEEISLPKVLEIGSFFLEHNRKIKKVYMPHVQKIGWSFLRRNRELKEILLPEVLEVDGRFLCDNTIIRHVYIPKVKKIGCEFLEYAQKIEEISLPEVLEIGYAFLARNKNLKRAFLPRVQKVGNNFLEENTRLEEISLPEVLEIGDYFIMHNHDIKRVSLPSVTKIGAYFLLVASSIDELIIPEEVAIDRPNTCCSFIYQRPVSTIGKKINNNNNVQIDRLIKKEK